jgi:hypothetical protein
MRFFFSLGALLVAAYTLGELAVEAFTPAKLGPNLLTVRLVKSAGLSASALEALPPAAAAIGLLKKAVKRRSEDNGAPPLKRVKPRRIAMMIEPTPFTHVSGYSNRFKELLRYLAKAGDNVEIITTECEARMKAKDIELPSEIHGYPIHHTQGFIFPLYNHIALSLDLPEMLGAKIIERLKPDLIHVTSP